VGKSWKNQVTNDKKREKAGQSSRNMEKPPKITIIIIILIVIMPGKNK
jgi:hypothetical protein